MANPGTPITNSGATTSVTSNYLIDDRTGFKEWVVDGLERDGHIDGLYVSKRARDERHPAEDIRSLTDKQTGPQSPEQTDVFVSGDYDPDTDFP